MCCVTFCCFKRGAYRRFMLDSICLCFGFCRVVCIQCLDLRFTKVAELPTELGRLQNLQEVRHTHNVCLFASPIGAQVLYALYVAQQLMLDHSHVGTVTPTK